MREYRSAKIKGETVTGDHIVRIVRFILGKRYGKENQSVRVDRDGCVIAIITLPKSPDCFCGGSRIAKGCDVCVRERKNHYRLGMKIVYDHMEESEAEFKQFNPDNPFEIQDMFLLLVSFK